MIRNSYAAAIALSSCVALAGLAGGRPVSAQAPAQNACGLLKSEEIQALAPKQAVPSGVASAVESLSLSSCRYTWGTGAGRMMLEVTINPASRMYVGLNADAIKQALTSTIVPDTADASISDVGQAASFKTYSAVYVGASALVKDRILQVNLDGVDARDMKGQVITLLKAASSRL